MSEQLGVNEVVSYQQQANADINTETSEGEEFEALIDCLPSKLKVTVMLGMFFMIDLLITKIGNSCIPIISRIAKLSIEQRLTLIMQFVFGIKLIYSTDKLIATRGIKICSNCSGKAIILSNKTYPRCTLEFLRDLGISFLAPLFPEKIFIQRFKCQNPQCLMLVGSLRRCDLPHSIYSLEITDLILTLYLGSGASYNVVSNVCKRTGRSISPSFIWKQVQNLGQNFSLHVQQIKFLNSGHYGVDECYPRTIEGKCGILAAIDQQTRLIVSIIRNKTFKKDDAREFLKTLEKTSGKMYSLMSDLSKIYFRVTYDLPGRVIHLCCLFHVKRNFRQFYKSSMNKVAQIADPGLQKKFTQEMDAILIIVEDIFTSRSAVEAQEKMNALLEKTPKYTSHPELPLLFKYLRNNQDLLVQLHGTQSLPLTNNYIERFFGYIRHKLKITRGWKQEETLLMFTQALAIYRNYLTLQDRNIALTSPRTNLKLLIVNLTFAEYLYEFVLDMTVSSPNAIPLMAPTDWYGFFSTITQASESNNSIKTLLSRLLRRHS